MAEPARLSFDVYWKMQPVRLQGVAEFERRVAEKSLWRDDEDHAEFFNWLDDNAPGWRLTARRGEVVDWPMPVGREKLITMIEFHVDLVFLDRRHREAWSAFRAAKEAAWKAEREEIKLRIAAAPEGAHVCHGCGSVMEAITCEDVTRLGQFGFQCSYDAHRCPGCETLSTKLSIFDNLIDAWDRISDRVGLPADAEDPLFTDEVYDEWKRRRQAAPEIMIKVTKDMSADDIVAAVDAQIAPRPARPRLVEA